MGETPGRNLEDVQDELDHGRESLPNWIRVILTLCARQPELTVFPKSVRDDRAPNSFLILAPCPDVSALALEFEVRSDNRSSCRIESFGVGGAGSSFQAGCFFFFARIAPLRPTSTDRTRYLPPFFLLLCQVQTTGNVFSSSW